MPVAVLGMVAALSPLSLPLSGVPGLAETIGFWRLAGVLGWLAVRLFQLAGDRR
ncbi:hypothetical protein FHU33_1755 [Blastococcus colisei]|uniref:Uncharacterized protein n=1 Tax=Blastococcus colisei TaxID=1564162 RepID=A0A543PE80_9ACTN|nr:hypothetical protein [Blastococcus colisei]TQN42357.1 hypothetical protein FHU33_1755 [Blastococcus colisei]